MSKLLTVLFYILSAVSFGYGSILYNVVDLASHNEFDVFAYEINEVGTIVGVIDKPVTANAQAVIFDATGGGNHVYLGTLGGPGGVANDINGNGDIVGWSGVSSGAHHATIFDASGAGNNTDLGMGLFTGLHANSINDTGQIVGSGYLADGSTRAVLIDNTAGNNHIQLGTLGGATGGAGDINNAGVIIGIATNNNGYNRGVVFDASGGGNNFDLGTLGGLTSKARDINEAGQIVGLAKGNNGYDRATLFGTYSGGSNLDLGTLGGDESKTWAINDTGQIVGLAQDSSGDWMATLFDATGAGANLDLNDLIDPSLGIQLTVAKDINNLGQIVCQGVDSLGNEHAFLLNPILEPAELLAQLVQDVIDLDLDRGAENRLLAKLGSALQKLDDGNKNNDVALINSLEAFINAVEAQAGKKITETDADDLIDSAQKIIDLLNSED